jgi:hypothetical protein
MNLNNLIRKLKESFLYIIPKIYFKRIFFNSRSYKNNYRNALCKATTALAIGSTKAAA